MASAEHKELVAKLLEGDSKLITALKDKLVEHNNKINSQKLRVDKNDIDDFIKLFPKSLTEREQERIKNSANSNYRIGNIHSMIRERHDYKVAKNGTLKASEMGETLTIHEINSEVSNYINKIVCKISSCTLKRKFESRVEKYREINGMRAGSVKFKYAFFMTERVLILRNFLKYVTTANHGCILRFTCCAVEAMVIVFLEVKRSLLDSGTPTESHSFETAWDMVKVWVEDNKKLIAVHGNVICDYYDATCSKHTEGVLNNNEELVKLIYKGFAKVIPAKSNEFKGAAEKFRQKVKSEILSSNSSLVSEFFPHWEG